MAEERRRVGERDSDDLHAGQADLHAPADAARVGAAAEDCRFVVSLACPRPHLVAAECQSKTLDVLPTSLCLSWRSPANPSASALVMIDECRR